MAVKKRGTTRDLWKRKTWYDITAPPLFESVKVGETPALEKKMVEGRKMSVIASEVGDGPRNMKLLFRVSSIEGNKAKTELEGVTLMRSYLRSMTRRRSTKVSSVLDLETKDGKKVRLKAVAFTLRRCTETQRAALQKQLEERIEEAVKELTFEALVTKTLAEELQAKLKEEMSKVYPTKKVLFSSVELK